MSGSPCASGLHYKGRCWMSASVRPLCPCPPLMTRTHCPRKPASPPPASVFRTCHPSRLLCSLNVFYGQKQTRFSTYKLNFLSFSCHHLRLSFLLCILLVIILKKNTNLTKYLYENKHRGVVYSIHEVKAMSGISTRKCSAPWRAPLLRNMSDLLRLL